MDWKAPELLVAFSPRVLGVILFELTLNSIPYFKQGLICYYGDIST